MKAFWTRRTEAVRPSDPRLPQPTFWAPSWKRTWDRT
jgi:hypothetical protein